MVNGVWRFSVVQNSKEDGLGFRGLGFRSVGAGIEAPKLRKCSLFFACGRSGCRGGGSRAGHKQ